MTDDGIAARWPSASGRMRRQAERNTGPELAIRRELHRMGHRYFLHRRPIANLRRTADLLFPSSRVAVFVHGCFWHGCPDHATWPRTNREFWRAKIERNRARDAETLFELARAGWRAVEIWEHEAPNQAAMVVHALVRAGTNR